MSAELQQSGLALPPAPVELREMLELARGRGERFTEAWAWCVARACSGRGESLRWREAFEETRAAWQRAFERQPATSADLAMLTLLADRGDLRALGESQCEYCGTDLEATPRGTRYCSALCRRRAAALRERERERAGARRISHDPYPHPGPSANGGNRAGAILGATSTSGG